MAAIREAAQEIREIRPPSQEAGVREAYTAGLLEFQKNRGRDLYFPFLSSGFGSGPFVELADGSVKYDMITGIGIGFLGHAHPEYISEMIEALPSDVMQGNLEPGVEARDLLKALLACVGAGARLQHAWLMCSGTMANEIALKLVRQKRAPATRILAFKDCFAGRSTAMQEITDNPGYRVGQPVYGEVSYLSFYDPKLGLQKSLDRTLGEMCETLGRYPDKFAALMLELVQGEGGFQSAPREFYTAVFEVAKKAGLAIWVDEIQTFGRTGELFAYQKFDLGSYVDLVTIGKLFQACAVLYTAEYNPKPGLVAGTFSGSTVALRTARRTLELLTAPGVQGADGKIARLSAQFESKLTVLRDGECKGLIGDIRVLGGMVAFEPLDGKLESVKAVLMKLFDLGLVAFYCGHGPYLVRLLPPLMVMEPQDVDAVCALLGRALKEVAKK